MHWFWQQVLIIWNLATPDIEGFFDIEAFNIEGCFNIEYTTFDIELLASISKLTKNLLYQRQKTFYIKDTSISKVRPSISKVRPSISGSYIEVLQYWIGLLRYQYTRYSISKFTLVHIGPYIKDTRYQSSWLSISKFLWWIYRTRYRRLSIVLRMFPGGTRCAAEAHAGCRSCRITADSTYFISLHLTRTASSHWYSPYIGRMGIPFLR